MEDKSAKLIRLTAGLGPALRQWQRLADGHVGNHGITPSCVGTLLVIGRSGGGIRQVTLAQQLGMEGPSLVRLLDKLCSGGLVRRECDVNDRRANLLWLTDKGQTTFVELEQALNTLRAKLLGELSVQDIEGVLKFYRVLAEASTRLP